MYLFLTMGILILALSACRIPVSEFNIQYICLHLTLPPCIAAQEFAVRVADRTNGRVNVEITSQFELKLNRLGTLNGLLDGTLDIAEIYRGHFFEKGDEPILDLDDFWGLYPDYDTQQEVTNAIREDIERIVMERTGGLVLAFQYYPSNYIFAKDPLRMPADMQGIRTRFHTPIVRDLLAGMGAAPNAEPFGRVYDQIGNNSLDAAETCSACGNDLKWHEVTDYLIGPFVGLGHSWLTVSSKKWAELPPDIQTIIMEESQVHEDATRINALSLWDVEGLRKNEQAGMEHIEFNSEMKQLMREAALTTVLPQWAERVGGYGSEPVELFNRKVAPIVKVEITNTGQARAIK